MAQTTRLGVEQLHDLIRLALTRAGLAEAAAQTVAAGMAACERDGVKGHGLLRLPALLHSLRIGWIDGDAIPAPVSETPSVLTMDARQSFAQFALSTARSRIQDMARRTGAAILLTRNSHHFSALWPDVEPFATDGFVAFSCVNSKSRMASWGGGRPVTGTNAMAFAAPRPGGLPLVWDQSSSVASQGDVLHAAQEGREVAPGIGVDALGKPTTSPGAILDGGALLPFGGAKGASLAVMVEILAAALTGGPFGFEYRAPPGPATTSLGGQFLLVIDPTRSSPDFLERMVSLCQALADAGADRLPGDRRYEARRTALAHGILLDGASLARLRDLAGVGAA